MLQPWHPDQSVSCKAYAPSLPQCPPLRSAQLRKRREQVFRALAVAARCTAAAERRAARALANPTASHHAVTASQCLIYLHHTQLHTPRAHCRHCAPPKPTAHIPRRYAHWGRLPTGQGGSLCLLLVLLEPPPCARHSRRFQLATFGSPRHLRCTPLKAGGGRVCVGPGWGGGRGCGSMGASKPG